MRAHPKNSQVTLPEFNSAGHYFEELSPKEQWMHVAGSYDFLDKSFNFFINGELKETFRTGRFILKTGLTINVGSFLDLDTDNNASSVTSWIDEQSMTCLQLYNIALNEAQVRHARDLCKTGVMDSMFNRRASWLKNKELMNPDQTTSATSSLKCYQQCVSNPTCNLVSYDSDCRLDPRLVANMNSTFYQSSSAYPMEKEQNPERFFV